MVSLVAQKCEGISGLIIRVDLSEKKWVYQLLALPKKASCVAHQAWPFIFSQFSQVTEKILLLSVQLAGDFYLKYNSQVAAAATAKLLDTFALDDNGVPALTAWLDFNGLLTIEGFYLNAGTQDGVD
jgi:hypothetical protein